LRTGQEVCLAMKTILSGALALTLLAGGALAQGAAPAKAADHAAKGAKAPVYAVYGYSHLYGQGYGLPRGQRYCGRRHHHRICRWVHQGPRVSLPKR
jgi:hypothetical protein